jgi:hypothetical protein
MFRTSFFFSAPNMGALVEGLVLQSVDQSERSEAQPGECVFARDGRFS